MRVLIPLLAGLMIVVLIPAASASPTDVCGDHHLNVDGDVVYEGSICQDGHVTVCDPLVPTKCWTHSWCTFCPGPVLF